MLSIPPWEQQINAVKKELLICGTESVGFVVFKFENLVEAIYSNTTIFGRYSGEQMELRYMILKNEVDFVV